MIKGQKVICVDDKFGSIAKFYVLLPKKDSTYTIRNVSVKVNMKNNPNEVCLHLQELVNPKSSKAPFPERGFNSERFRPLTEEEELATMSKKDEAPATRENVFIENIV